MDLRIPALLARNGQGVHTDALSARFFGLAAFPLAFGLWHVVAPTRSQIHDIETFRTLLGRGDL